MKQKVITRFKIWVTSNFIKRFLYLLYNGILKRPDSFQSIYDDALSYHSNLRLLIRSDIPIIKRRDIDPSMKSEDVIMLGRAKFAEDYQIVRGSSPMQSSENLSSIGLLLHHFSPRRVLEIGTHAGMSTINLAVNNPALEKLVTIDIQDLVTTNPMTVKLFKALNIEFILTDSKTFKEIWDKQKFDFIFIDGDHSYEGVKFDTELAFELISKTGIIVWDDYRLSTFPGIQKYLNELAKEYPVKNIAGTSLGYLNLSEIKTT